MKLLLADLDGTITLSRDSYKLGLKTVEALRKLESNGIKVGLVSGNSYPVLRGLATYLGLTGGVVAENGCVVYYSGNLIPVCVELDRSLAVEFATKFGLRESWQNEYRKYEFAFSPPKITEDMRRWAEERGLYIKSSGYAVHISKNREGKAVGVRKLIEVTGLSKDQVVGIGDSDTDVEFLKEVGIKVAVANADESLKSVSDFITKRPSSEGVRELAELILRGVRGE
ncbi:MAG: phosphoglycolate phosphatase [Thermoprotei archaeon]